MVDYRYFDNRRQEACAIIEAGGFEERLLLAWLKRAHHRDRSHQAVGRNRGNRVPVGRDLVLLKIRFQTAVETLTVEPGLVLPLEITRKRPPFRHDTPVALQERQLLADTEPANAGEGDQKASVLRLGKRGYAAGATDRIDWRVNVRGCRIARLHHADQPLAGEGSARHREIARLENV